MTTIRTTIETKLFYLFQDLLALLWFEQQVQEDAGKREVLDLILESGAITGIKDCLRWLEENDPHSKFLTLENKYCGDFTFDNFEAFLRSSSKRYRDYKIEVEAPGTALPQKDA